MSNNMFEDQYRQILFRKTSISPKYHYRLFLDFIDPTDMRKKTTYHGHELILILNIYLFINRITCMQSCFALASEVFSTQVQIYFWYVKVKMLVLNCLCQPEQEKVTFLDCSVSLNCVIIILKAKSFSYIYSTSMRRVQQSPPRPPQCLMVLR